VRHEVTCRLAVNLSTVLNHQQRPTEAELTGVAAPHAAAPWQVLTVNFCQPSHEFTFGVGINFISYPLVLTPWYNKFVRACQFWSLMFMQEFSVESKTSG
jgi:hypothetical protein